MSHMCKIHRTFLDKVTSYVDTGNDVDVVFFGLCKSIQ